MSNRNFDRLSSTMFSTNESRSRERGMKSPFNPYIAEQLMRDRLKDHDDLARTLRLAILCAMNPDPDVSIEDKLNHLDPGVFRRALADVVSELIGWEEGVELFVAELRAWCDDDLHESGGLL
jgi:hypothetical protein